jgi:hypothetical protein
MAEIGDKVRNRATGDAIGTIRAIRANGNILAVFDMFSIEGLPAEFEPAADARTLADLWITGEKK